MAFSTRKQKTVSPQSLGKEQQISSSLVQRKSYGVLPVLGSAIDERHLEHYGEAGSMACVIWTLSHGCNMESCNCCRRHFKK